MEISRIYGAVLESMGDLVYVRDLDKSILYINPASEKLTGWSLEKARGKKCYEVFGDEHLSCRDVCPVERAISQRLHILHHEGSLKTRSGEIHEMQVSISPIYEGEAVAGAVVVMEDITRLREVEATQTKTVIALEREIERRRRVEEALQEAHELHEKILSAPSVGILAYGSDGRCVSANEAVASMIGATRDQALKQNYRRIKSWEKSGLLADAEEVLSSGVEKRREIHVESTFGKEVWLDCRFNRFTSGEEPHLLLMVHDITDRKKAEDHIKASLKEKEVLLREIHHRVKNNLAIIHALLTLQATYSPDKANRNLFEDSQNRIRSMALAHEVLYQSENLSEINVSEYVGKLVDHLAANTAELGGFVTVTKEIEDVCFDLDTAIPIGFLLTELVSNCMKHAFPEGRVGQIRISLQSIGEEGFELMVADNGVGMPEGVDRKNSKSLGLDLVDTLVEQLSGQIEIVSNEGTEVRIRFKG